MEQPDNEVVSGARSPLVEESDAAVNAAVERLGSIERAITALEDGTYGRCEVCSSPIEADRLARRASETRCAAHESAGVEPRLF